ncbi:suppressor of glycerol defect protein 1 [[Candida] anglica]
MRDNEEDGHGIRLPGSLLDQIKQKEDKGEYNEDGARFTKFDQPANGKKRKGKPISRKEKRQQERELKKQKRTKKPAPVKRQPPSSTKKQQKQSTKAEAKKTNESKNSSGLRIVKEDDLDDDEVSDFDDMSDDEEEEEEEEPRKSNGKNVDGFRVVKEDELDDDEFSDEEDFDEEDLGEDDDFDEEEEEEEEDDNDENPLEKLRKLKEAKKNKKTEDDPMEQLRKIKEAKKNKKTEDDPMEQLRKIKEAKKNKKSQEEEDTMEQLKKAKEAKKEAKEAKKAKKEAEKKSKKKEVVAERIISSRERELMEKDEKEMAYYAKKLGLKNGKKGKLTKQGEDDVIGGLLDGLDFDFSDEEPIYNEEDDDDIRNIQEDSGSEEDGYDDEEQGDEGEGHDDMDLDEFDEDELRELREMEDLENASEDEDTGDTHMVQAKENPFVAPEEVSSGSKYIPPAMRRQMALAAGGETVSEEVLALQRAIKGPLNKLSEANVGSIVNDINSLYSTNPRQVVTENLTKIVMDSVMQQGRLLDTFVCLHACLIVAIHRLQGTEFGAYFIQTLIEKFDSYYQNISNSGKELSNIISLLSSVFTFQLISSRLLYDLIKVLINDLNENTAELLLRLIQNSGNQMRSDDPSSLKEIILLITKKSSEIPKQNTRTQFLIETITSLKNNKLKVHNDSSQQLVIRIKKILGGLNGKYSDPLQVSLDDIRNVATRGKWWLVGSAWKGREQEERDSQVNDVDQEVMNDILDNAEPNWMELARSQRMNTDIRRAIFISIMSANDYVDAMTKLDKLALKRSQEREIPRILIHCTGVEPAWNPYYGVLSSKLCDNHSYRKTFQFMLWDLIKEFDGPNAGDDSEEEDDFLGFDNDETSDDDKLKRILNLGRFFGYLLGEGSLPLNILRTVDFVTASGDTLLFVEILLITFLDQVAKKSQVNSIGAGLKGSKGSKSMYDVKFDSKVLVERIAKAQEQPILLKGIQYFLNNKAKQSGFITGRKQRARVEWAIDTVSDLVDDLLKTDY